MVKKKTLSQTNLLHVSFLEAAWAPIMFLIFSGNLLYKQFHRTFPTKSKENYFEINHRERMQITLIAYQVFCQREQDPGSGCPLRPLGFTYIIKKIIFSCYFSCYCNKMFLQQRDTWNCTLPPTPRCINCFSQVILTKFLHAPLLALAVNMLQQQNKYMPILMSLRTPDVLEVIFRFRGYFKFEANNQCAV